MRGPFISSDISTNIGQQLSCKGLGPFMKETSESGCHSAQICLKRHVLGPVREPFEPPAAFPHRDTGMPGWEGRI